MTIEEAIERLHAIKGLMWWERWTTDCKAVEMAIKALEELKAIKDGFTDDLLNMGYTKGYNKAIDEFTEKIQWEYLNSCGLKQREIDFLVAVSSMVAEQMKSR